MSCAPCETNIPASVMITATVSSYTVGETITLTYTFNNSTLSSIVNPVVITPTPLAVAQVAISNTVLLPGSVTSRTRYYKLTAADITNGSVVFGGSAFVTVGRCRSKIAVVPLVVAA